MPVPRILLLSRKAIEEQNPSLLSFLATVQPVMAVAQSDADKEAAQTVCEVVGTFQNCTAIVADFAGCLVVNDDGSTDAIVLPELAEPVPEPLIKLAE
jgi:hypothetical protein